MRMFNSRKVKTVKVCKDNNNLFVRAHIFKSCRASLPGNLPVDIFIGTFIEPWS